MTRAAINSQYVVDAECALVSQDIANNRSLYYGRVLHDRVGGDGYWTANAQAWSLLVNNVNEPTAVILQASGDAAYDFRGGVTRQWLWEGNFWVNHNPDGSHPGFVFAGSRVMANPPGGAATAAQTVYPPTIPRATTPNVSGGAAFDAGATITINLPRASSMFTHNVSYVFGGASGAIANGAGVTAQWAVPLALLAQIPSATSGKGTIRVATYNGSTLIGTKDLAVTIRAGAGVVPTIPNISAVDDNPTVASVVGAYVAGLSILKATVNAAGAQGSTITARSFKVGSVTAASGGRIPLTTPGDQVAVTASATDSRGRVGSFSGTLKVLPYAPPTVTTCLVRRATSTGVVDDNGAYLRLDLNAAVQSLTNGTQRNAMTVSVFTRQKGATAWTARNVINPGLTHNNNVLISGGGVFASAASWEVRVEVADKFMTSAVQTLVPTSAVLMHWSTGVGVMKFWEKGALDVGGDIYSTGNINAAGTVNAKQAVVKGGMIQADLTAESGWAGRNALQLLGSDDNTWVQITANKPVQFTQNGGGRQDVQIGHADSSFLPWAMYMGIIAVPAISAGNGTAVNIPLPPGRFTVPPRVFVMSTDRTNYTYAQDTANTTVTSARINVANFTSAAATAGSIIVLAVQMTAASAVG